MTTGVSVRALASPGFALALVVLVLNDHVLKTAYPGWVTGKLSDVAGLVFVDATHEVADSRGFAILPLMYALMGIAVRFGGGRRWLMKTLCPPGAPASYRARLERRIGDPALWRISLRTGKSEGAGIRPSLAAVARDCPDLPAVPVHVLTAGGVAGPNVKQIQRVHAAWKAMVERSPQARYTNVPSSGHQMPAEVPGVVVEAISGVLETLSART